MDREELLFRERVRLHYPLTKSPFAGTVKEADPDLLEEEEDEGEDELLDDDGNLMVPDDGFVLKVKTADEVPWIDLILEIAMTTALANLTNNTTISRGIDVLGYLCFWGLTWWAWASTVAYNIRFRQADWFHRWAAILQLAVFGALAAFTQNFDITSGLSSASNPSQEQANQIMIELGQATSDGVAAMEFQQKRAPILNFRGIAMTMAWSRVLLMTQYIIVYYHVPRHPEARHRYAPAILVHIISLAISSICFFVSFGLLNDPTVGHQIAKIVLWYAALLLEVAAHFIPPAFNIGGHVRYRARGLYSRASVLFLIVLGQGLDSITNTFSFAVGPAGFGKLSVGLLISTAIILIGQFSLFFGSPSLKKLCIRGLAWFFGQFVYTCALIVLVSAVVNELFLSNYEIALNSVTRAMFNTISRQINAFPNQLNQAQIPSNDSSVLMRAGIAPNDILNNIFAGLSTNNFTLSNSTFYKQVLSTFFSVSNEFDLQPKQSDPLYWEFQLGLSANFTNNLTTTENILGDFLKEHNDSLTWFPAAAGATFIIIAILRYIRQTPRDRYEWANIITISGAGIAYSLLSFLDIGSNAPRLNIDLSSYFGSPVFSFVQSGWVLPSYAIVNLLVLLVLGIVNYYARKASRDQHISRIAANGLPASTTNGSVEKNIPGLPRTLERVDELTEMHIDNSNRSGLVATGVQVAPTEGDGDVQGEIQPAKKRRASSASQMLPGVQRQRSGLTWSDPFKIARNDSTIRRFQKSSAPGV